MTLLRPVRGSLISSVESILILQESLASCYLETDRIIRPFARLSSHFQTVFSNPAVALVDRVNSSQRPEDLEWMDRALELAREAGRLGEVPVGAILIKDGRVLSQAYNLREHLGDPTAHAERLALTLAGQALGNWHLDGCTLYVTLEPCVMCAGAILLGRIQRLVYAASDRKAGACQSLYRLLGDPRLNHRVSVTSGVRAEESSLLLSDFFRQRR